MTTTRPRYIPRKRAQHIKEVEVPGRFGRSRLIDDEEEVDVTALPLSNRLRLADRYAAAHAGHPISGLVMDLFPELNALAKRK